MKQNIILEVECKEKTAVHNVLGKCILEFSEPELSPLSKLIP